MLALKPYFFFFWQESMCEKWKMILWILFSLSQNSSGQSVCTVHCTLYYTVYSNIYNTHNRFLSRLEMPDPVYCIRRNCICVAFRIHFCFDFFTRCGSEKRKIIKIDHIIVCSLMHSRFILTYFIRILHRSIVKHTRGSCCCCCLCRCRFYFLLYHPHSCSLHRPLDC